MSVISTLKAAGDFIETSQDKYGATFGRDILKTIDAALAGHEGVARNRDDLVLNGLRASCTDVCSYATPDVPSSGCDGKCKRELNDFIDDDIRNMRAVIDALEAEHVETDIAMVELLKEARVQRDQARKDVAHANQKLIESNDARQVLADDLVAISKLALPAADRIAIREALKEGLRLVGDQTVETHTQEMEIVAKLTAALGLLGEG